MENAVDKHGTVADLVKDQVVSHDEQSVLKSDQTSIGRESAEIGFRAERRERFGEGVSDGERRLWVSGLEIRNDIVIVLFRDRGKVDGIVIQAHEVVSGSLS